VEEPDLSLLVATRVRVESTLLTMFMCSAVQFYLKFGCSRRSNVTTSSSEPVLLRYSCDGGIHWSVIGRYDQLALTSPTYVVVSLPYEAKTNSTRLHWWQPVAAQSHRADWAIDQVRWANYRCMGVDIGKGVGKLGPPTDGARTLLANARLPEGPCLATPSQRLCVGPPSYSLRFPAVA